MSNVSVFNFNQNEVRTIAKDDGEIWFVASDVCKALEISNTSDALRRLDEDEATLVLIEGRTPTGGIIETPINAVNESGLYSLVLGSRKPEAKQFKKWVTSDVLPSIRKNGGYIVGQEVDTPEILMAKALQVANNILESKTKELEVATAKVELLEPKANALDTLANAEGTVTLDQAAKLLGVQPKKFLNPWLIDHKWCFRRSGEINPHQDKVDKKYLIAVYRTFQGRTGEQHTTVQTRILGLNSATEQNNQSLKINVKDAKDAEKAALDAAKAKEQLTKQTQRLNEQLAKEQAQSRATISYGFADDLERLNIDYQKQIQEINHADFKGEREKYLKLAQDRYDFSTEMYLRQLTEENDSFRWSEEYKLKFYFDTQREIASKSGRFNDEMKELRMQKLNEQEQQELALIKLAQEQRLFQSRLFLMSEMDAIRERYRLERKEIELTVKDESELRKRLALSKDQEQLELLTRAAQATKNWQSTYSELTGNSQMFQLDQTRQDRTGQSLALADSQNSDVMVRAQDPNADLEALAAEQEAIWQAHRDRMALIDQDYWGKTKAYQLGMAADVFGGLSGVMLNFVDESSSAYRMMIAAQKGANLASVFMSNLTAISAAWSSAPFPANLPAVALTTAKTGVLQATLQAFTPQGFATGGQIRGPGTTTSDSIPIMASDKEFMFKASSAASIGLENLNYMNKTGELPPNHDAAQLSAIQRQQRQSDLINTSINQRSASSTQSAAPTVVDNQMVVNNVFNPKDIPDAMATPYGAKVFMNFIKLNKSSIRGMLGV